MARIRTVKPKFWDDTKLSKVSRDARLLYIGIWNFCDDLGVLIGEPVWIKSKIFPYDKLNQEEFDVYLDELINEGFLLKFDFNKEKYIFVKKFSKHQRINKPNNDDIYIDREQLKQITEQSRINHGLINDEERINHVAITGGVDRIVKDSKGKDAVSVIDVGNKNDERLLCPSMSKIIKNHIPFYATDTERDYQPLFSIAQFIFSTKSMEGEVLNKVSEVCKEWDSICAWLKNDTFYSQKSLKTISTHIQEIYTKSTQGTKVLNLSEYEQKLLSEREKYKNNKKYQQ